jgi:hypothetical protein
MLFKRFAVETHVVRKPKNDPTVETAASSNIDVEQINEIAKDFVTHAAVTVGAVVVGTTLLKTVCEIAVIVTKAKLK